VKAKDAINRLIRLQPEQRLFPPSLSAAFRAVAGTKTPTPARTFIQPAPASEYTESTNQSPVSYSTLLAIASTAA
jgi:hypothetical protein